MCVVAGVALAGFALDVGGKVMAAHAQDTAAATNTAAANVAQAQGFNSLALRGTQEQDSAIGADRSADQRTQLAAGINNNAASNNGVAGNSIIALNNELQFQKGTYHDSVAENLSNQVAQLGQERLGIEARTSSRINAVQPANPWATAMGIAGAALHTGMQFAAHSPAVGSSPDVSSYAPPKIAMSQSFAGSDTQSNLMAPVSGPPALP